jgi:transposase
MDETTVRLLGVLVKCWMRRGRQKRIATPGQQKWYHLFGVYHWRCDTLITMTAEKKNSASFCLFIEQVMQTVPADKLIVLVLDNASFHHSAVSEATLAFFEDRCLVVWLPPYCSDLNPIERFWRHLKETACANCLFKTIQELLDSVDKVLAIQNELSHPDRFIFSKT